MVIHHDLIKPQVELECNENLNLGLVVPLVAVCDIQPMAEKLGEVLKSRLAALKRTQVWLANEVGVSNNAVTKWIKTGKISRDSAIKAAAALQITTDELLSASAEAAESLPDNSFRLGSLKPSAVPVVGRGMGGLPDVLFTDEGRSTESYDEFAETYSSDSNAFVTRVEGNSMFPKYCNGDYALVEPSTIPELEDDVLVKINTGQVMLKRLLSRRGGIHLGSYNEAQTYDFQAEEIVWMYYVAHPVPARKIRTRY